MTTLDEARALDAADPLAHFRARFTLPEGVIYLDGNSLGALPADTPARVRAVMEAEWGEGLIRSWNAADWIGAPARVGGKIARLIGAEADEVVAADSTSVNLFKLLHAGLSARPSRSLILHEAGDFPTDGYIAQGLAAAFPGVTVRAVPRTALLEAVDDTVAIVLLSQVHYKTAERWGLAETTARAHAAGALMLWDLSHSAGAIPIDLNGAGADLAVGCGYKFLNGGPGAPAYLFVARRWRDELRSPLSGWMGHAAPFAFEGDYRSGSGVTRFLCGTPPILSLAALEAGVDLALEAHIDALAAKSAALFDLFHARVRERCGPFGFRLVSPEAAFARGSHISLAHPEGHAIMRALVARGVIGDFRAPDILRFGLTPLYTRFEDVWRAVEILAEVMEAQAWRDAPALAGPVT